MILAPLLCGLLVGSTTSSAGSARVGARACTPGQDCTTDDLNHAEFVKHQGFDDTTSVGTVSPGSSQLQYLNDSELAVASRYLDIANAQSSIDMTSLIWDPCSTISKVLTKKLAEKANGNPKVSVRLMIDSYFQWDQGGKTELSQMQTYFQAQGIEVKFFNPPDIGITGGNEHSHSKLLLIDKNVPGKSKIISGGRNMSDAFFGMDKDSLIDRDVEISGQSVPDNPNGPIAQAATGFEKLWNNPMGKSVRAATPKEMNEFTSCTAWGPREERLENYLKQNAKRIVGQARKVTCPNVKYTIDDVSGTDKKPTTQAVLDFLKRPKHTLTMENQYYIPTAEEQKIFDNLREKVKINLYSNLFDGSSEFVVVNHRIAMRADNIGNQRNFAISRMYGLLDKWPFTPSDALYHYHAKTFVSDGTDAAISSFNIDPRSQGINSESGVFVTNCPAFAQQVEYTAQLTAYELGLEEKYAECANGFRAHSPDLDPFSMLFQLITRPLQ